MGIDELMSWAIEHPALTVPSVLVVGLLATPFARSVLDAIREGREFNLGPLKLGGRSTVGATDDAVLQSTLPVVLPEPNLPATSRPKVDLVYTSNEAAQFYGKIAAQYDVRNIGPLLSTQMLTKSQIRRAWGTKPALDVLDLGGGTGREIATHFAEEEDVTWTYVDFCPAMVAQFQSNLVDNLPVRMKVNVRVEDILHVHRTLQPESYDVVLLSLVLTSMPEPPNLAAIATLLRTVGTLIVSDIDPLYTERNPLYTVRVDDSTYSLRTAPVQPHQVAGRAAAAGLRHIETATVTRNSSCYAFVTVFTRPPAVLS